ncbi:MAG: CbtA family protein [Dehalococcoidales bacterium]|nr:CbtA family protein [Dehalococcoidales bacterium]MDZ4230213.1 CbtA family protein [Dehalococcoidales bacterium]
MSSALKAALVAGLVAGLAMGLFHFFFTEPIIDQAIALETEEGSEVVSRAAQRGMLIIGSGLYGLAIGAVFALVLFALNRRLPGRGLNTRAVILAGILFWAVALLPFLKYPANPPGVGNPDTMYFRQMAQISFIAFSALAVLTAGITHWLIGRRWGDILSAQWRLGITAGLYGVLVILLFILMPDTSEASSVPSDLIRNFRILSLSGHALFWLVLGGVSAILLKRIAPQEMLRKAV